MTVKLFCDRLISVRRPPFSSVLTVTEGLKNQRGSDRFSGTSFIEMSRASFTVSSHMGYEDLVSAGMVRIAKRCTRRNISYSSALVALKKLDCPS